MFALQFYRKLASSLPDKNRAIREEERLYKILRDLKRERVANVLLLGLGRKYVRRVGSVAVFGGTS